MSAATVGISLGFSAGRERILRRPTALSVSLGVALVLVGAAIERSVGSLGAVDRALEGTFRLVIPLVSFGIATEASARGHLRDGVWPVARFGAARRDVALGLAGAAITASAAVCAAFAAATAVLAHAHGAPPILRDVFQTAWIGGLVASTYAAWFMLGATFWKRGRARWIPLIADFVVGGSAGIAGALLPHGHAQNLLGAGGPLHFSQPASSFALFAGTLALSALAALRCRD